MDTSGVEDAVQPTKRSWRRYDLAFKERVIELALQPQASVAAVALANGLNANMLRRWVRDAEGSPRSAEPTTAAAPMPTPLFVQLPMPPIAPPAPASAVTATTFVEIHREGTCVYVTLPAGADSAAWVREVLR